MEQNNNARAILRKSAIYIRTSAATTEEVSSDQEMRELLGRGMVKRGDELLRTMEQLIRGKPITPPEESVNLYEKELQEADVWFTQVLQNGLLSNPRWELIVHPPQYQPEQIKELPLIEKLVKDSQVNLRGWEVPCVRQPGQPSNFNTGYQSHVDWNDIREAFRFHKSGLFVFKRSIWEDRREVTSQTGGRALSFISAIFSVTEWLIFLSRAYGSLEAVESLHISVRLIGCNDRALVSTETLVPLLDSYVSHEETISWSKDVKVVELRASPQEIAGQITKHIFNVFNWTDVPYHVIRHWQQKLVSRSY